MLDIADRLPDVGDALGERILGDADVRPDRSHQFVFRHHMAGVFRQAEQQVEGARPKVDARARLIEQFAASEIDNEILR